MSFYSPVIAFGPRKITRYNRRESPKKGVKELAEKVKIEKEKLIEVDGYYVDEFGEIVTCEKRIKRAKSLSNLENNSTNGQISHAARKRILDAVNWLALYARNQGNFGKTKAYRLSLLTLTLPACQLHSDIVIKHRCLNLFLQHLRNAYGLKTYIWRAEKQKNGNLHFHLVINVWVDKWVLRKLWNDALQKLGYIDRFEQKHGHRNPPSTQIEKVHKVQNLAKYLGKYLAKNDNTIPVEGRQWFLSETLSKLKPVVVRETPELLKEINSHIDNYNNAVTQGIKYGYKNWNIHDYAKSIYLSLWDFFVLPESPLWDITMNINSQYSPLINN